MPRGKAEFVMVFYKGQSGDTFAVMVDKMKDYEGWKKDPSIPLPQVVSGFKVFTAHKGGPQGTLDTASKSLLQSEFGTADEDTVIKKILREGHPQVKTNPERQGDTNPSNGGAFASH